MLALSYEMSSEDTRYYSGPSPAGAEATCTGLRPASLGQPVCQWSAEGPPSSSILARTWARNRNHILEITSESISYESRLIPTVSAVFSLTRFARAMEKSAPLAVVAATAPVAPRSRKGSRAATAAGVGKGAGNDRAPRSKPGPAAGAPAAKTAAVAPALAAVPPDVLRMHTDDLSSDDELPKNTIGNVPLKWYDEYDHIGYGVDGKKIAKPAGRDGIDRFLASQDDPHHRWTIYDEENGEEVVLSKRDVQLVARSTCGVERSLP